MVGVPTVLHLQELDLHPLPVDDLVGFPEILLGPGPVVAEVVVPHDELEVEGQLILHGGDCPVYALVQGLDPALVLGQLGLCLLELLVSPVLLCMLD